MDEKPSVYNLNDSGSFEKSEEDGENSQETDSGEVQENSVTAEEARRSYPDEVWEEYEQDVEGGGPDKSEKSEEVEELAGHLDITEKLDYDTDFSDLSTRDSVVINTPLEGAKVGDVVNLSQSWTGTLQAKVDTGANEYTVTPFDDEYSTSYVATVGNKSELKQDVLGLLERKTVTTAKEGDDVVADVPQIGPIRAKVEDIYDTENQGKRVTLKSGDVRFVVYEEPTSTQTKEQPFIVGSFRDNV